MDYSKIPVEIKEKIALASAQAYITNQMHLEREQNNQYMSADEYVEPMMRAYQSAKRELVF